MTDEEKGKRGGNKTPYVLANEPRHFELYVECAGVVHRMVRDHKKKMEVTSHETLCRLEDKHDWQGRYIKHLQEVNKRAEKTLAEWKAERVKSQESVIKAYEAMLIPSKWDTETKKFIFNDRPDDLTLSQTAKIVNDAIIMSLKLRGDDLDISHLYHVIEHKTDIIMGIVMKLIGEMVRTKDMPTDASQKFCYGLKNSITRDILMITDEDMKS